MLQDFQENYCGDCNTRPSGQMNCNAKRPLASLKPSYISKFANKVRNDARKNKQHWSSMGLPSSVSDPQLIRPTARNLSPIRPCDLESNRSFSSLRVKESPMNSLPLRNMIPRSKWQSYYKMKPTLVRSKEESGDKFTLPPIEDKLAIHNEASLESVDSYVSGQEKSLVLPEINNPYSERRLVPARMPIESNTTTDLIPLDRFNQVEPKQAWALEDLTNRVNMIAKREGQVSDKTICDALILKKLQEIQNELQKGHNKCFYCDKNEENDHQVMDDMEDGPSVQHCYTGDVDIIDRGPQKDFLFENALNCSRSPPKCPSDVVMDDGKGHKATVSPRMVFKRDYGRVPLYLQRRKEQQLEAQEEFDRLAIEEANRKCRAVSDDERQAIIDGLSQHWEQLFAEFQKLPLVSTAPRVLKRKSQLEAQLRDLESDLRLITSHGRLFVSNEGPATQFLWK